MRWYRALFLQWPHLYAGSIVEMNKPKKCAICETPFIPKDRLREKWCSYECGSKLGLLKLQAKKDKEAKAEKKRIKESLIKLNPRKYWEKRLERVCNAYIKQRDKSEPCISCGAANSYPRWQAGHYISVGANKTLRYDEDNINKQCVHCNMHKGGNATAYRQRLVLKIGEERVLRLESWHAPDKRTVEELIELYHYFVAKTKSIKD